METPIQILFEDSDLIVINKPAGMVVNKAVSAKGLTVQEWAEEKVLQNVSGLQNRINESEYDIAAEFQNRGGVVHRLDKETSGILIIAKNVNSFGILKEQFKNRGVTKKYIALVHGRITTDNGLIDAPIGRLPWNRMRFGVFSEGRQAVTEYKVLEHRRLEDKWQKEELTLVELYPKTGRTHQIRVHLRHIGNPIFADELYSGRKQSKKDRKILKRHFLHASYILLKHPTSGEDIKFECKLPSDLEKFLELTTSVN